MGSLKEGSGHGPFDWSVQRFAPASSQELLEAGLVLVVCLLSRAGQ
jgi:hypothetical protein